MQIRTDLGGTRERARELRVEPTGSITATNVQKALEAAASIPPAISATAVAAAQSPYAVLSTDTYLFVDSSGGPVEIDLQAAGARNGVPLVVKDIAGSGSTNAITIKPLAGETIDTTYTNAAPLTINADFGGFKLGPRSGTGYTIIP